MSDEQTRLGAVRRVTAADDLPAAWRVPGADVRLVAGSAANDDCAVIDVEGRATLVIGSDYVRGVKFTLFERGLLSFYDLGWYLATANLSDVAAMGAQPVGLLTVIRYPPDLTDSDFDAVMNGIAEACRAGGANPMGGDIGTAERLFLSASAFGLCEVGKTLRRVGARPGDLLCVTGPVGTPAAALVFFDRVKGSDKNISVRAEEELLRSWRRPQARVAEGLALARVGARACQDISDGLRDTLTQLCSESGVGCVVDEASLPIEPAVGEVARAAGLDQTALALGASVDFELTFALAPGEQEACRAELDGVGGSLHVIGCFVEELCVDLQRVDGSREPMPGASWRHQSDDPAGTLIDASRPLKPDAG